MPTSTRILLVGAVLSCAACQSRQIDLTDVGPPLSSVSFSAEVLPLFVATCGGEGCHIGESTNGVDLSSYSSVRASVGFQYGRAIVVPGDANGSPLIDKLSPEPSFGTRMPTIVPLGAADINLIRVWIDEGALDN